MVHGAPQYSLIAAVISRPKLFLKHVHSLLPDLRPGYKGNLAPGWGKDIKASNGYPEARHELYKKFTTRGREEREFLFLSGNDFLPGRGARWSFIFHIDGR